MSFKVVVETDPGEYTVVHEVDDRRVTRVNFGSSTGGAGTIGVDPNQTEVTISFEYADPYARNLLDLDYEQYPKDLDGDAMEERRKALDETGRPTVNVGRDFFDPETTAQLEADQKAAEENKLTPDEIRAAQEEEAKASSSV